MVKIGMVASLTGAYNYFGVPIHNGAFLALQEANDAGAALEVVVRDDGGRPERTRRCLEELDEEGVVAVIGPVESHNAALGAEEARAREIPVITPSATASFLTATPNPWFFRAISPDRDRTDALARWAKQDLQGRPMLVVHEVTPPEEEDSHPPLYGESAGQDFLRALDAGSLEPYPRHVVTFTRDDVLARRVRHECARLLRDGAVDAAAILAPSASIIAIGTYLRQQRPDLPLYIISPGRDLFERSSLEDDVKAVTDTVVEDTEDTDLRQFRTHYCDSFPDDTEDPVAQYATFAHDAARIVVAAVGRAISRLPEDAAPKDVRAAVCEELRSSPPRPDLLMSSGNFVLNNDLFFKPSRRVLTRGQWVAVPAEELRTAPSAQAPAAGRAGTDTVFDVFLSYRHGDPDEHFTRGLRRRLTEAGFRVAFDRADFDPVLTFLEEMERCVRESRFTALVISPRYRGSSNTTEEAIMAQVISLDQRRPRVIPLIFEPTELPWWLHAIVGIDFSRADPDVDPNVPPV